MKLHWYDGNEEGYTDDLGIIADVNQWVPYRPPGWYLTGHNLTVHLWCLRKLRSYQILENKKYPDYYIEDEQDVMLLKLRWPV